MSARSRHAEASAVLDGFSPPHLISPARVRGSLWLLMLIALLGYLDRYIINILAEPIRQDLRLSDTQLGLLTGLAFALFYTSFGLPLARAIDRPKTNRVRLIGGCLAVWSAMTMFCGLGQNFGQLLLARVGVGAGEAGCTPAAHSLITDMVPREKHASAMALFGLGVPVGGLLGMVMGGLIADHYGWRTAFLIGGAPGLILAVIVLLVMKDPRSGALLGPRRNRSTPPAVAAPSLKEAILDVCRSRAFVLLVVATSFMSFMSNGKAAWQAVFFIRVHHLSAGETGLWLGITSGLAGMLGIYLGGFLSDRLRQGRPARMLWPTIGSLLVSVPLLIAGYLATDWRLALLLIFLPTMANNLFYAPMFSCVQHLVSPTSRALATALVLFVINLVGLGLGPLFFGVVSDLVAHTAGDQSVRWVLVGSGVLGIIPATFYWLASRRLDLELKS